MSMEKNQSFVDGLIESIVKKAPLYAKNTTNHSSKTDNKKDSSKKK